MRIGCDTGFFGGLLEHQGEVEEVWQTAAEGEHQLVMSCISLFELRRLGLRGAFPKDRVEEALEYLPESCEIVWLGSENGYLLERASRIAHGNGLAMADAIILTSLMAANVEVIYSSDSDFEAYPAGPRIVKI